MNKTPAHRLACNTLCCYLDRTASAAAQKRYDEKHKDQRVEINKRQYIKNIVVHRWYRAAAWAVRNNIPFTRVLLCRMCGRLTPNKIKYCADHENTYHAMQEARETYKLIKQEKEVIRNERK